MAKDRVTYSLGPGRCILADGREFLYIKPAAGLGDSLGASIIASEMAREIVRLLNEHEQKVNG